MKKRYIYFILGTLLGLVVGLTFSTNAHASDPNEEIFCMAKNIYFEAGNQPIAGKIAVAQVVQNRVKNRDYPNTICGVVYQARWKENWKGNMYPVRNMCQLHNYRCRRSTTYTSQ